MLTTGMPPLNMQNHDTDRGLASVDVRVRQQHACQVVMAAALGWRRHGRGRSGAEMPRAGCQGRGH